MAPIYVSLCKHRIVIKLNFVSIALDKTGIGVFFCQLYKVTIEKPKGLICNYICKYNNREFEKRTFMFILCQLSSSKDRYIFTLQISISTNFIAK